MKALKDRMKSLPSIMGILFLLSISAHPADDDFNKVTRDAAQSSFDVMKLQPSYFYVANMAYFDAAPPIDFTLDYFMQTNDELYKDYDEKYNHGKNAATSLEEFIVPGFDDKQYSVIIVSDHPLKVSEVPMGLVGDSFDSLGLTRQKASYFYTQATASVASGGTPPKFTLDDFIRTDYMLYKKIDKEYSDGKNTYIHLLAYVVPYNGTNTYRIIIYSDHPILPSELDNINRSVCNSMLGYADKAK
jgi:hypothetical protein